MVIFGQLKQHKIKSKNLQALFKGQIDISGLFLHNANNKIYKI